MTKANAEAFVEGAQLRAPSLTNVPLHCNPGATFSIGQFTISAFAPVLKRVLLTSILGQLISFANAGEPIPSVFSSEDKMNPQTPMTINEAVEELVSGRNKNPTAALDALTKSPKEAPLLIIEAMRKNKKFDQRKRLGAALLAIAKSPENRDAPLLHLLGKALETTDYSLASGLMPSLSEFKANPIARELLLKAARNNSNPHIRTLALGRFYVQAKEPRDELAVFRTFLADKDERVQMTAARLLGRLGESDGHSRVLEILNRPITEKSDFGLIILAVNAAEAIGSSEFIPILEAHLANPHTDSVSGTIYDALAETRLKNLQTAREKLAFLENVLGQRGHCEWAAFHLTQIGSKEAIAILEKAASNPDHPAYSEATESLKILKGR